MDTSSAWASARITESRSSSMRLFSAFPSQSAVRPLQLIQTVIEASQMSPNALNLLHDRHELRAGLVTFRLLDPAPHEVATRGVLACETALHEQLQRLRRSARGYAEVIHDRAD